MSIAIHELDHSNVWFTQLLQKIQAGDEIILTQQGEKIARIIPLKNNTPSPGEIKRRITLMKQVQKSAAGKIKYPEIDAAHSQDFLYDDDGIPG